MAYEYEGKSNISFSIGNKLHFWNVTDDNLRVKRRTQRSIC